jgi:hypothetical protein
MGEVGRQHAEADVAAAPAPDDQVDSSLPRGQVFEISRHDRKGNLAGALASVVQERRSD